MSRFQAELEKILGLRETNRRQCEAQESDDNLKLGEIPKGSGLPLKVPRRVGVLSRGAPRRR